MWIAFKNLIFDYWTQRSVLYSGRSNRCELLSKILSLTIEHNADSFLSSGVRVVNCFQKSYLWLLNTTNYCKDYIAGMLWIAFKNLIFDYWTQRSKIISKFKYSCELLSKILSLTIEHNWHQSSLSICRVVNCFQKSYLWLLNTTYLTRNSRI